MGKTKHSPVNIEALNLGARRHNKRQQSAQYLHVSSWVILTEPARFP